MAAIQTITGPHRERSGVQYWRCEHCNRESTEGRDAILHTDVCPMGEQ